MDRRHQILDCMSSVSMRCDFDCGTKSRSGTSARTCGCIACKKWFGINIPGYAFCPICEDAYILQSGYTLGANSGVFSNLNVCEQCFDSYWDFRNNLKWIINWHG